MTWKFRPFIFLQILRLLAKWFFQTPEEGKQRDDANARMGVDLRSNGDRVAVEEPDEEKSDSSNSSTLS
jgi:hypothetical protein